MEVVNCDPFSEVVELTRHDLRKWSGRNADSGRNAYSGRNADSDRHVDSDLHADSFHHSSQQLAATGSHRNTTLHSYVIPSRFSTPCKCVGQVENHCV
ncbi:hypothetical protein TNCV_1414291 [Trichonephila clavipes]|nr:hypothetical protein TNCV_1414291 [Trichonephila clavipes]